MLYICGVEELPIRWVEVILFIGKIEYALYMWS